MVSMRNQPAPRHKADVHGARMLRKWLLGTPPAVYRAPVARWTLLVDESGPFEPDRQTCAVARGPAIGASEASRR
jgi:hypothetical protein